MKVKTWHIGCLVVLIAAALYFLVGTREGLDNSATCWDIADPTSGKFLDVSALVNDSLMVKNTMKANHCKPPPSPRQLTPSDKVCLADAGMYFSLEEAQAACANDGLCTAIVGSPAGLVSPPVTLYFKYGGNTTIVPFDKTPGQTPSNMINQKAYIKKPCAGSSSSASSSSCWGNLVDASTGSFISQAGENSGMGAIGTGPKYTTSADAQAACASDSTCTGVIKTRLPSGVSNQPGEPGYIKYTGPPEIVPRPGLKNVPSGQITFLPKIPCSSSTTPPTASPMPPGPTGTAGGSSMTPPVVPVPSTAAGMSYNLTCTAAPVSGMVGSAAAMPETPAAWNVTQPPSGWNSKNGYTTTGN